MLTCYTIPYRDQYLIYRPLRHLAFFGNAAMAEIARAYCADGDESVLKPFPEVREFFARIGFLEPDPFEHIQTIPKAFTPTAAALLMTNRCNLRCTYCYAAAGEAPGEDLPLIFGKHAIDFVDGNAERLNVPVFSVVFHGGGEPTLPRQTLFSLAEYAMRKPRTALLNIVSNGFWTNGLAEQLMSVMSEICISMDGSSVTQNRQRPTADGSPSFDIVMRNVEKLSAVGFPFTVRMTVTPQFFSALPENVRFLCAETGCTSIQAEPAFNAERGSHSMARDGALFSRAFLEAWDIAASYGKVLFYSGARPQVLGETFCNAPVGGSFTVNPRGEITGCYEMTGREGCGDAVFGQMDENGFQIDEDARQRFIKDILNRKTDCRECFCYYHCAGDCFTRGLKCDNGEWPYSRCQINREITLGLLLRSVANA